MLPKIHRKNYINLWSLQNYERQIKILKEQNKMFDIPTEQIKRNTGFYALTNFAKDQKMKHLLKKRCPNWRPYLRKIKKQLMDAVENKIEVEEKGQQDFIETIKDQFYDEHLNYIERKVCLA